MLERNRPWPGVPRTIRDRLKTSGDPALNQLAAASPAEPMHAGGISRNRRGRALARSARLNRQRLFVRVLDQQRDWQDNRECAAGTWPLRGDLHSPAMRFDQV